MARMPELWKDEAGQTLWRPRFKEGRPKGFAPGTHSFSVNFAPLNT